MESGKLSLRWSTYLPYILYLREYLEHHLGLHWQLLPLKGKQEIGHKSQKTANLAFRNVASGLALAYHMTNLRWRICQYALGATC